MSLGRIAFEGSLSDLLAEVIPFLGRGLKLLREIGFLLIEGEALGFGLGETFAVLFMGGLQDAVIFFKLGVACFEFANLQGDGAGLLLSTSP